MGTPVSALPTPAPFVYRAASDCWPTQNLIIIALRIGDRSMEHKGVRYTIRAGIERGMWSVAIHPSGIESSAKLVYGKRGDAEFEAHSMIDRWPQKPRRRSKLKAARDAELK